jgi:hypothetical protein
MRAALICDLFASAFIARVHLSLSLTLGGADSSQRCKRGMLPVVRAHLIVVYIISVRRGCIVSERAHREMLFFLSAERQTRLMGAFSSSLLHLKPL